MKLEGKMGKRALYQVERGKYKKWRQRKKSSKIYLAVLFALCEGKCPVCGVPMVLGFTEDINKLSNCATLDHTIPLIEGLETKKWGLEIMCIKCNTNKGNKHLEVSSLSEGKKHE